MSISNKSTKFKKYDRNRFRKIYPINRFPASNSFRSDAEVVMESLILSFSDSERQSTNLQEKYSEIPTIVFSSNSTGVAEIGNVNLFISAISRNEMGVVSFTIDASAPFTGDVSIHVLSII